MQDDFSIRRAESRPRLRFVFTGSLVLQDLVLDGRLDISWYGRGDSECAAFMEDSELRMGRRGCSSIDELAELRWARELGLLIFQFPGGTCVPTPFVNNVCPRTLCHVHHSSLRLCLLSMLVTDLLQLSKFSLLARFTNDPDSVYTHSLPLSIAIYNEEN